MTKDSKALANALRKITEDPLIEAVKREDVAQMFIEHPKKKNVGAILDYLLHIHQSIKG